MDRIKTLRPGDCGFYFNTNGIYRVARAGLDISQQCPDRYKDILLECINQGWIQPVAHMKESEYVWEKLQQD